MRVFVLLLMLAAISACSRYNPVPPGEMITCDTGRPSDARSKGCG